WHLLRAQRWQDLETVLTDPDYVEAVCAAGRTFALVADYHAALAAWPGPGRYDPLLATSAAAVSPWTANRITSEPALARLRAVPEQAREHGAEEARCPRGQALPAETFLADQGTAAFLERARVAEAATRAGRAPYARDTLGARVQAFAAFVTTHSHFLHENPHALLPLARNQSPTGFLADQTPARAEALRRPWIAREQRPESLPPRPHCLRVLKGHTAPVAEVALSSDGRRAVSAGHDALL